MEVIARVLGYDMSLQVLNIVVYFKHIYSKNSVGTNFISGENPAVNGINCTSYFIERNIKYFNHLHRLTRKIKKILNDTADFISHIPGVPLKSFQKLMKDRSWRIDDGSTNFVNTSTTSSSKESQLNPLSPLCIDHNYHDRSDDKFDPLHRGLKRSIDNVERWLHAVYNSLDISTLLIELDQNIYNQKCIDNRIRREIEAKPRRLQQYFASSSNIDLLMKHLLRDFEVDMAHHYHKSSNANDTVITAHNYDRHNGNEGSVNSMDHFSNSFSISSSSSCGCSSSSSSSSSWNIKDILFIEPSCGDGRIIKRLLSHGALNIIGIDIDPDVVRHILKNNDNNNGRNDRNDDIFDKMHHRYDDNNNDNIVDHHITVVIQDYLTTSRCSLIKSHPNYADTTDIYVVGGPPYTIIDHNDVIIASSDGDVCGDNDVATSDHHNHHHHQQQQLQHRLHKSDFPLLFLIHSAIELQASKIVFILPDRCHTDVFINIASHHLNMDNPYHHVWKLETSMDADSTFTLMDREIKQPAVIQVWTRNK